MYKYDISSLVSVISAFSGDWEVDKISNQNKFQDDHIISLEKNQDDKLKYAIKLTLAYTRYCILYRRIWQDALHSQEQIGFVIIV